jgi:ferredoxin
MRKTVGRTADTGYLSFRRSAGRLIDTLEYYSARFFGERNNPFTLSGAILIGLIIVSAVTGALMLLFYMPSPEHAAPSVHRITTEVSLGSILRAFHRASADLIVIVILFHGFRAWATGRYASPRSRNWLIGLLALPLIGIIGWAGYILPWDERALVLLAWGKSLAYGPDRWPIIGWLRLGSLVGGPVFAVSGESDQLLRILALHIGGAFVLIGLVIWHLGRVTPPRAKMPIAVWIGALLVLWLFAAMIPLESEELLPFNPFAPPQYVHVDFFVSFPLLFYPLLGGAILSAVIVIVLVLLAVAPRLERRIEPTAVVREIACTGCRLCLNDCPYGAITMVPHFDPAKRARGREIARVLSSCCSSCGICVGSCAFAAIELPTMTSDEVISSVEQAMLEIGTYRAASPFEEVGQ